MSSFRNLLWELTTRIATISLIQLGNPILLPPRATLGPVDLLPWEVKVPTFQEITILLRLHVQLMLLEAP